MKIIVTGGAGFIGSRLVRSLLGLGHEVLNLDKLTYSGRRENLTDIDAHPDYRFEQIDICDGELVRELLFDARPDALMHLAAESHVDRSIDAPGDFIATNVSGTFSLLVAAREFHATGHDGFRFLHVSTDEVYGALGADGTFREDSAFRPNSPYAASKAASDHLARAWFQTYSLPVLITHCSNNYGPNQFPEKLIPLTIRSAIKGIPVGVYGDGLQVRDWLFVDDHVHALVEVLQHGRLGETYNIGGSCEKTNLEVVQAVLVEVARQTDAAPERLLELITHVSDRPGHDRRYALDASRVQDELGWCPEVGFERGIESTVAWYLSNDAWCSKIESVYDGRRLGELIGV